MKIINYSLGLLFFASLSYGETAQHDKALFKAINNGNFRAVQTALYKGASINAIDGNTGDTPIFFATKKLLKTILEAHDDCYINSVSRKRIWLSYLRTITLSMTGAVAVLTLFGLITPLCNKYNFKPSVNLEIVMSAGAFAVPTLGIFQLDASIDSYFRNKKSETIPSLVAIINLLSISYGLDKTYIHPKINTTFQDWLTAITHAKPSGRFELVRNYEIFGTFIDNSYNFVMDNNETVYCSQEAYLKHVKPTFEKLSL